MILCKVVDKDEGLSENALTLGFPDENGAQLELDGVAQADMDAMTTGVTYSLSFMPAPPASAAPVALPAATPIPVVAPAPAPSPSAPPAQS
jgi:hypothetical protein